MLGTAGPWRVPGGTAFDGMCGRRWTRRSTTSWLRTSTDVNARLHLGVVPWARALQRRRARPPHRGAGAAGDRRHSPESRADAVSALVALEADGAAELALTALRDPRTEVRHIVASQLAPTGDRRVVDALVELLDDADGYVREAATIGLQSQGDAVALGPLRGMLRRERSDRAAEAGAKRAIRALEKAANRSDDVPKTH